MYRVSFHANNKKIKSHIFSHRCFNDEIHRTVDIFKNMIQ